VHVVHCTCVGLLVYCMCARAAFCESLGGKCLCACVHSCMHVWLCAVCCFCLLFCLSPLSNNVCACVCLPCVFSVLGAPAFRVVSTRCAVYSALCVVQPLFLSAKSAGELLCCVVL
jgi:hypothetical protein